MSHNVSNLKMKANMLDGKVIIVAGGTGGIGMETCRLLASRGATLIIAGKRPNGLETLLGEIRAWSPESISFQGDLSLFSTWEGLVDAAAGRFNRIDSLINCVGLLIPGSFDVLKESDIERVVGANLLGAVYGIKAVLPTMKRQQSGHIINVGSLGGIVPMPFEALYSATKFAVRGLSLSLNEELQGTGIQVSLIEPSAVRTKMLGIEATDDQSTITFVNSPLEPNDVAEVILSVLESPRREVILPRVLGRLASLLGMFPNLLAACYPVLNFFGSIGLKRYRKNFLSKKQALIQTGA